MTQAKASLAGCAAAIAGTGFMGWVHAEALRRIGVRIAGALGSSAAKSASFAEPYGAVGYESYDQLLQDPQVDVVHITTPNDTHFAMARDAILAGKHVLCEKPLAMTAEETAQLVALAAEHPQLHTGVNYNIRFYPLCCEARQRIDTGALGRVFHVTGSYVQDWLLHQTDYNWRVRADRGGALRAVADIGTHWMDLLQWITGQPIQSVCADLQTAYTTRHRPSGEVQSFASVDAEAATEAVTVDTDDAANILLRFADGSRGSVSVSQVTAGRKNCLRYEIAGASGAMAWNSEKPCELWLGSRDAANSVLLRDPALLSVPAAAVASYPGGHNEGYDDSFKQSFLSFYGHLLDGEGCGLPTVASFAEGHREVAVCEAILHSHSSRGWVDVT
ncbi:Gfo/Idh/MocA family protein [Roseimaritima ulvae]|uniref:1,5-anhydro-D-fructose reductase n=1 Tax=Roseimaritima ulvae TaxID=980254 RepID=A0A5B9QTK3_9BACT|nr:Gfo/Idh/MocA family oxidoreductase [Roseimaritima ulvae]QEG41080.1 1,5-anhydro-D-fructose reductase [Roseimaritima ulvae]